MPWIGHIVYGLSFLIPLLYLTKDSDNKFNYKVAFIFLVNNLFGPDASIAWAGFPFHSLLGFLIFAIPLSLFYSYLSRFSLSKSEGPKFGLQLVDGEIREVNWKNSYLLCVSGGIFHFFIDQFYHWERNLILWPTLLINHEVFLSWGGDPYHVLDPTILVGYSVVVLSIVASFYCLKQGYKETLKLFIAIASLSLLIIFTVGVEAFLGEREVGVIFHSVLYIFIPFSLLVYVAKDVNEHPIQKADVPKVDRDKLLKGIVLILIVIALVLMIISVIALMNTDMLASPLAKKLKEDVSDTILTIQILGGTIFTLASLLLVGAIGLLFRNAICRKIVIVLCVALWVLAFPVAIALFLNENDVKSLFVDNQSPDAKASVV